MARRCTGSKKCRGEIVADFGLISAEDKAKIASGIYAITTDGVNAYFYNSTDTTTTPVFTLRLSTGVTPLIRFTKSAGTAYKINISSYNSVTVIENYIADQNTTEFELSVPCYGTFQIYCYYATTDKLYKSVSVTVNAVKVFNVAL